jgi:hypothetical protein
VCSGHVTPSDAYANENTEYDGHSWMTEWVKLSPGTHMAICLLEMFSVFTSPFRIVIEVEKSQVYFFLNAYSMYVSSIGNLLLEFTER